MQLNIYEAKAKLSNLLDRAVAGEIIVIARAGEPMVRLVPIKNNRSKSGVTFGGQLQGKLNLAEDFSEPITAAELLGK